MTWIHQGPILFANGVGTAQGACPAQCPPPGLHHWPQVNGTQVPQGVAPWGRLWSFDATRLPPITGTGSYTWSKGLVTPNPPRFNTWV